MKIEWVFDPAPPSGGRRGGNAAEYGFEGHVDILVRETVQNSMDAGKPQEKPVSVKFRLVELTGDHMERFLNGIGWSSLQENLHAVKRREGQAIRRAIESMRNKRRILNLCIEDRNTDGLTGNEIRQSDSEKNRFSALVRDELYSDKDTGDAGGSYGLGKILLWAYSAYKTVFFSTVPRESDPNASRPRFIGRASLPYHETANDGPCAGDGWFGERRQREGAGEFGRYAVSLWGDTAIEYARRCHIYRAPDDYGLSTLIVGFEEPGEETRPIKELIGSIRRASLESFWPALARNQVCISITHEKDGEVIEEVNVDPFSDPAYGELAALLQAYDGGEILEKKRLDDVGDAGYTVVDVEVPRKITDPSHPECTGKAIVLVKLVEDIPELDPVKDNIYRFRRPGMIVRHSGAKFLSITARPYIAAVLCGRAAGDGDNYDRVEFFLRDAEPPEHDKWQHDTRAIKENYQTWGVRAKLDKFEASIKEAVRELVSLPEKKGGALPKELLRLLKFGDASGGGRPRFLTSSITARVKNDDWNFAIKIKRARKDDKEWHAIVRLKYAVDGGSPDEIKAISSVQCEKAAAVRIKDGRAYLEFPGAVVSATINGVADKRYLPAVGTRAAIQVVVDGGLGAIQDV